MTKLVGEETESTSGSEEEGNGDGDLTSTRGYRGGPPPEVFEIATRMEPGKKGSGRKKGHNTGMYYR